MLAVPSLAAVIVAPNAYESAEADATLSGPFQANPITLQWIFAASQFSSITSGTQLTAIGFRLNGGSDTLPVSDVDFTDWNLQLSSSLNAVGSLSATFANNIGPDAVTVRSGALTIPASSFPGGATPNGFYFIPFSTAYTYNGGDLLLTLTHTGGMGAAGPLGFANDALTLGTAPGITDTVLQNSYQAGSGSAQFFNSPVTAFRTDGAVPEPSALFLAGAGLAVLGLLRRRPA